MTHIFYFLSFESEDDGRLDHKGGWMTEEDHTDKLLKGRWSGCWFLVGMTRQMWTQ